MTTSRSKRILEKGSPDYILYPGVITAGNTKYYDLENEADENGHVSGLQGISNYLPMDFIHVINNDIVDIQVIINGTKKFYYPSGLAQGISEINVHSIAILNMDSATSTTANKISVTMRRKPSDADSLARRLGGFFNNG